MMRKTIFLIVSIIFTPYYNAQNNTGISDFDLISSDQKIINDDASNLDESIKIPIFTINTGKIIYPIFLTYDMSGIAVDRIASDVGLGWEVSNSFLQREVRDKVDIDEAEFGKYPVWSASGYENNSNEFIISSRFIGRKKGYQQVKKNNIREGYRLNFNVGQLDHEPDLFHVQSPILSTSFYYPNSLEQAVELNNKSSIITQESGETLIDYTTKKNTTGSIDINMSWNKVFNEYKKFFIKKNDGIKMTFDNPEFIQNITFYQGSLSEQGSNYGVSDDRSEDLYNTPIAEKWNISKISDLQAQRDIIFEYETYSSEDNNDNSYNIFNQNNKPFLRGGVWQIDNYRGYSHGGCYINYDEDGADYPFKGYSKIYKRYIKKKRIKAITFDEGKIEFFYNKNREDFHNGKALTRIEIKNKENKLVNSFDFEYGYFESEQYRNEFSKRLKLLSFTQLSGLKQTFEYYEDNKMPQIGSYNKDFYGYCNTSNDNFLNPYDLKEQSFPIYYYYPDKYEFSILPYNIESEHKISLGGIVTKEPNELAKTWSLKKIKYSTGGYVQYNLETNTFNLWGKNLKGCGVRIASKTIAESESDPNPRVINYSYNLPNGNSSGTIYNFPLAGYPTKKLFTSYIDDQGILNSSGSSYNGDSEILNNFLLYQVLSKGETQIKYSEIKKNEGEKITVFNFKTIMDNTNRYFRDFYSDNKINLFKSHCISEFLYTNSGIGFDNQKSILHYPLTTKMYKKDKIFAKISYLFNNAFERQNDNILLYTPNETSFKNEIIRSANIAFDKADGVYDFKNLILSDKKIFTTDNYLVQKKYLSYFENGNKEESTIYFYGSPISGNPPMLSGTYMSDNFGNNYSTDYIYPDERYSALINENILTTQIGKIVRKNDVEISNISVDFEADSVLPKSMTYSNSRQSLKTLLTYDLYDNKGNLISYKDKNGVNCTIIYGYNQTYPIAIIKGMSYSQVMQEMHMNTSLNTDYLKLDIVLKSNLDKDAETENEMLIALDTFRNNSDFDGYDCQITTYTYNPLIGITSITPPSGIREIYKYDTANRLQSVVDVNGKILKEYQYNYQSPSQPQIQYYNVIKSQNFTRNNCGSGYVGGSYTYTVPAGKYSSTISQADADLQAQTDINTNGQNATNQSGACTPIISCPFTFSSTLGILSYSYSYISSTDGVVNLSIAFSAPNTNWQNWSNGINIGTIGSNCIPSVTKSFNYNEMNGSGRVWLVTINTSGNVNVKLLSGTGNSSASLYFSFNYQK